MKTRPFTRSQKDQCQLLDLEILSHITGGSRSAVLGVAGKTASRILGPIGLAWSAIDAARVTGTALGNNPRFAPNGVRIGSFQIISPPAR
jgi:hypothetical protein